MLPQRLHQLRAFLAVYQAGSVTLAAEMLHLSQPAVTKLVHALEAQVGIVLFDRSRRRLTPTREAVVLRNELDTLFSTLDRTDSLLNALRNGLDGRLHIAAVPAVGNFLIPGPLSVHLAQRPSQASVTVASSATVNSLVQSGAADIGFCLPVNAGDMVNVRHVITLPSFLVLPRSHRLSHSRCVDIAQLEGDPFVTVNQNYGFGNPLVDFFRTHGFHHTPRVETQSNAVACGLVEAGVGFAIVDAPTAYNYRKRICVLPMTQEISFPIRVIYPPSVERSSLDHFIPLVEKELERMTSEIQNELAGH